MAKVIVFMGAPGAGKGTQAQLISQRCGWPQISTGEILRQMAGRDTALGRQVKQILDSGQLVSDDILADIIQERTGCEDCRDGYILDGFPRTRRQAELLDRLVAEQGNQLTVINFKVDHQTSLKRLAGRRREQSRSDDTPDVIWKRLEVYEEKTAPVIEHYRERGTLVDIDAERTIEDIFQDVLQVIESGHQS